MTNGQFYGAQASGYRNLYTNIYNQILEAEKARGETLADQRKSLERFVFKAEETTARARSAFQKSQTKAGLSTGGFNNSLMSLWSIQSKNIATVERIRARASTQDIKLADQKLEAMADHDAQFVDNSKQSAIEGDAADFISILSTATNETQLQQQFDKHISGLITTAASQENGQREIQMLAIMEKLDKAKLELSEQGKTELETALTAEMNKYGVFKNKTRGTLSTDLDGFRAESQAKIDLMKSTIDTEYIGKLDKINSKIEGQIKKMLGDTGEDPAAVLEIQGLLEQNGVREYMDAKMNAQTREQFDAIDRRAPDEVKTAFADIKALVKNDLSLTPGDYQDLFSSTVLESKFREGKYRSKLGQVGQGQPQKPLEVLAAERYLQQNPLPKHLMTRPQREKYEYENSAMGRTAKLLEGRLASDPEFRKAYEGSNNKQRLLMSYRGYSSDFYDSIKMIDYELIKPKGKVQKFVHKLDATPDGANMSFSKFLELSDQAFTKQGDRDEARAYWLALNTKKSTIDAASGAPLKNAKIELYDIEEGQRSLMEQRRDEREIRQRSQIKKSELISELSAEQKDALREEYLSNVNTEATVIDPNLADASHVQRVQEMGDIILEMIPGARELTQPQFDEAVMNAVDALERGEALQREQGGEAQLNYLTGVDDTTELYDYIQSQPQEEEEDIFEEEEDIFGTFKAPEEK